MIYSVRKILRLHRKCSVFARFSQQASNTDGISQGNQNESDNKDFKTLLQQYKDRIVFSSYLEHEKLELGYFKYHLRTIARAKKTEAKELEEKTLPPLPISLKYYVDKDRLLNEDPIATAEDPPMKVFQLPFSNTTQFDITQETLKMPKQLQEEEESNDEFDKSSINKWMTNYEYFDDTKLSNTEDGSDDEDEGDTWCKNYGTPDPTLPISQVPCGGCGALLHCNEPAIPGYLPSELFKERGIEELKQMECQRCHFLKEYNIALDVTVQPEEYERLLQSIRLI